MRIVVLFDIECVCVCVCVCVYIGLIVKYVGGKNGSEIVSNIWYLRKQSVCYACGVSTAIFRSLGTFLDLILVQTSVFSLP